MPRGRKKSITKSYEEQLTEIDEQIATHKTAISELKKQRKLVLEKQEDAEIQALKEAVRASGKTPAEFLAALNDPCPEE